MNDTLSPVAPNNLSLFFLVLWLTGYMLYFCIVYLIEVLFVTLHTYHELCLTQSTITVPLTMTFIPDTINLHCTTKQLIIECFIIVGCFM